MTLQTSFTNLRLATTAYQARLVAFTRLILLAIFTPRNDETQPRSKLFGDNKIACYYVSLLNTIFVRFRVTALYKFLRKRRENASLNYGNTTRLESINKHTFYELIAKSFIKLPFCNNLLHFTRIEYRLYTHKYCITEETGKLLL